MPLDSSSSTYCRSGSFNRYTRMGRTTSFCISLLTFTLSIAGVISTTFTVVNKCDYTVWPGILSNAGVPALNTTGFVLQTGESKTIHPPTSWGGRFWGRTICSQDSAGKFSCVTGDCGSGRVDCAGSGATPPATLAEFTLNGDGGMDFFDLSLVDGYNVPMLIAPQGGSGQNCTFAGCVTDLNDSCPSELKVTIAESKQVVACKSACDAFGSPQYCCSGAYGNPTTCKPSSYSEIFKNACPSAYSYAYDDPTSTFTCANADYLITFCPSPSTSQKASQGQSPNVLTNGGGGMVYEGALDQSNASPSTSSHVLSSKTIAGVVGITVALWRLCHLF